MSATSLLQEGLDSLRGAQSPRRMDPAPTVEDFAFWTQIMGDHCTFIDLALDEKEVELHERVHLLKSRFYNFYDIAMNRSLNEQYTPEILLSLEELRELKLLLLRAQLAGEIKLLLFPTFINHMLNEVEEALAVLSGNPNNNPLHLNKVWLVDAEGHADAIMTDLDPTEHVPRKEAKRLKKMFRKLYMMNEEEIGYARAIENYPRREIFLDRINATMREFNSFLVTMRSAVANKEVIGRLLPLMLDHYYREECYYLRKLGFNAQDPAAHRVEM